MSGYDSVNRNVLSWVRKVDRRGADVTSGGRQLHTWGPATENARLPTMERWTGGWTGQSLQEEQSPRQLGRSATYRNGPRYDGAQPWSTFWGFVLQFPPLLLDPAPWPPLYAHARYVSTPHFWPGDVPVSRKLIWPGWIPQTKTSQIKANKTASKEESASSLTEHSQSGEGLHRFRYCCVDDSARELAAIVPLRRRQCQSTHSALYRRRHVLHLDAWCPFVNRSSSRRLPCNARSWFTTHRATSQRLASVRHDVMCRFSVANDNRVWRNYVAHAHTQYPEFTGWLSAMVPRAQDFNRSNAGPTRRKLNIQL